MPNKFDWNAVRLPRPAHELKKYRTSLLLNWLERAELLRCHYWTLYTADDTPQGTIYYVPCQRAAELGTDILEVLKTRNKETEATRAIRQTSEDYQCL